jgi:phage terminase small subunit
MTSVPATPTRPLNARQRAFIAEFMRDGNSTRAYQKVYECSLVSAEAAGARLLADVRVRSEIDRREAERLDAIQYATGVTLERVVAQIAKTAFFDPRRLFDAAGEPLPIEALDAATASNIVGLEVETRPLLGTVVRKYKLNQRNPALDMLMKHLGGYAKDNAIDLTVRKAEDVPLQELARRAAYLFRAGMEAANEPQPVTELRQAAS